MGCCKTSELSLGRKQHVRVVKADGVADLQQAKAAPDALLWGGVVT